MILRAEITREQMIAFTDRKAQRNHVSDVLSRLELSLLSPNTSSLEWNSNLISNDRAYRWPSRKITSLLHIFSISFMPYNTMCISAK